MKTALFTNFTEKEFTGYWDGKGKRFAPGQSVYMPDYLARHFAKHLVNRELLSTDASGNLIHKDGDKMTSPKRPEDAPIFMDLFNKAYQPDETEELGSEKDDIDALIGAANKNRQAQASKPAPAAHTLPDVPENPRRNMNAAAPAEKQDPTKPQIVLPPDFNEDDEDENAFPDKPKA